MGGYRGKRGGWEVVLVCNIIYYFIHRLGGVSYVVGFTVMVVLFILVSLVLIVFTIMIIAYHLHQKQVRWCRKGYDAINASNNSGDSEPNSGPNSSSYRQ